MSKDVKLTLTITFEMDTDSKWYPLEEDTILDEKTLASIAELEEDSFLQDPSGWSLLDNVKILDVKTKAEKLYKGE